MKVFRLALAAFCWVSALGAEPTDPGYFAAKVYPVFQAAGCRGCHSMEGVASATRLRFPEDTATADEIEVFGRSLAAIGPLLAEKPTGRVAHGGGVRVRSDSPEDAAVLSWIRRLATLPPPDKAAAGHRTSTASPLQRLTHSQYNNTVRDLLGDQTQPARQFPGEDYVDGFKNQTVVQSVSPLLAGAYVAAAEKLARNAFRFGGQRGLLPCRPASPSDADCASSFIGKFGLRAFRRPLSIAEHTQFVALLRKEAGRLNDFHAGAQLAVEAMLQSPSFLFRIERGGESRHFETASRLSFALWDTMPDEELLRAAAAGGLDTRDGVEKQARRMLSSPLAREAFQEFLSQWMRFDRLQSSVKDRRLYPEFLPAMVESMAEETRRLAQYLVWTNRNFMEFFSADYTFVNADLARLYDLPGPAEPFAMLKHPAASERAGVLGHGLFLAQTAKPEETSPTERGIFIREHFLCQTVPPPPPGLNATLPPFLIGAKPMTNRERLTALHLTSSTCSGCHRLVDPIGFGLERFDTIGRWYAKQQLTIFPTKDVRGRVKPQKHELELDTSASILGIPDSGFSTAKELGNLLARDATCQKCVVRQWFRFVFGRRETDRDAADLDRVFEDFRRAGFRFQDMMISLVTSDTFRRTQ